MEDEETCVLITHDLDDDASSSVGQYQQIQVSALPSCELLQMFCEVTDQAEWMGTLPPSLLLPSLPFF